MVSTVRVNANVGRDFNPLANHVTKLKYFTKGGIHEFSTFPFSLHLMFDQTLNNLTISQKLHTKVAQTSLKKK